MDTGPPTRFALLGPALLTGLGCLCMAVSLGVPPWGPPTRMPAWAQLPQATLALVTGGVLLWVYGRGAPSRTTLGDAAPPEPERDRGWLWLALAMFTWTAAHLLRAVAPVDGSGAATDDELLDMLDAMLSALNSMFLLFAAARLDDAGPAFSWLQRGDALMKAGVVSAVAILSTAFVAVVWDESAASWEATPAFTLSAVTIGVYWWGLFATLRRRRMTSLAVVWSIGVALQAVHEVMNLYPPGDRYLPLMYAVAMSAKAVICLSLVVQALGWVYELAEVRLDEAATRATELEGRLDEAATRSKELEGRLGEATTRSKEVEGRLDEAATRQKELEGRLGEATTRSKELEGWLDEAATREKELEGLLAQECRPPEIPAASDEDEQSHVRDRRERLGLGLEEFAARAGVSKSTMQRVERGERVTRPKLACILNKLDDLEKLRRAG